jgi:hypothetical protein
LDLQELQILVVAVAVVAVVLEAQSLDTQVALAL